MIIDKVPPWQQQFVTIHKNSAMTIHQQCPVFVWQATNGSENGNSALGPDDLISLVKSANGNHDGAFALHFGQSAHTEDEQTVIKLQFRPNRDLLANRISPFTSPSNRKWPCHFEAIAPNGDHSALSLCNAADINGLLRLNGRTFGLGVDPKNAQFFLSPIDEGSNLCGWPQYRRSKRATEREENAIGTGGGSKMPDYYAKYIDGVRRFVELVFIADHSMFKKYEENEQRLTDRLHSIASTLNSLYAPLNIRCTLVWADIWRTENPIEVTEEADKTLRDFLAHRKKLLGDHPHDNAELFTDVHFGSVIGKAYKGTMCSYDYSGGVIVDHAELPAFVGLTVAHEMGHNFGMDHDAGYPEPCQCAVHSCIMAPASSNINSTSYFSDCSLDSLSSAFRRGVDYCLHNVPKSAFGGAKCGNGILEEGEECDCGSTDSCPNKCCSAATCRLAKNAECAEGECCDLSTCRAKPVATVCRAETGDCDLPEYCDGENPICPPDFFVQDGHQCANAPEDFCYQGICGSRERQCQFIWGPSAQNAISECYAFNEYGSFSGNCGYSHSTEEYTRCARSDITCGRLQCAHESEKPVFGDPSTVYSAYNLARDAHGKDVPCRVIRTTMTGVGNKKQQDPGMVPNGAKCGTNKLCVDAHCRNASDVLQMVSRCQPEDCNGKGVCNNVGNCHCIAGYGGIACDLPGPGGSVNSGPANGRVFNPGVALLYITLVLAVVFAAASIYCRRKRGFWLHKKIWSKMRVALDLRSFNLVPTRKAPPRPDAKIQHTHRQSWNAVWGDDPNTKHGVGREVLQVDASRPYLLGGARATVVKGVIGRDDTTIQNQQQPVTWTKAALSAPVELTNTQQLPAANKKHAKEALERRALVTLPGYDTGGSSSSSDEPQPPPPPPHKKTDSAKSTTPVLKPVPPSKPPVVASNKGSTNPEANAKVSVRALAAKFDKC